MLTYGSASQTDTSVDVTNPRPCSMKFAVKLRGGIKVRQGALKKLQAGSQLFVANRQTKSARQNFCGDIIVVSHSGKSINNPLRWGVGAAF